MDQHINSPRSVDLDDDEAVAEAHGTAAGRFRVRSHNLFIKELPSMILADFVKLLSSFRGARN